MCFGLDAGYILCTSYFALRMLHFVPLTATLPLNMHYRNTVDVSRTQYAVQVRVVCVLKTSTVLLYCKFKRPVNCIQLPYRCDMQVLHILYSVLAKLPQDSPTSRGKFRQDSPTSRQKFPGPTALLHYPLPKAPPPPLRAPIARPPLPPGKTPQVFPQSCWQNSPCPPATLLAKLPRSSRKLMAKLLRTSAPSAGTSPHL